MTAPDQEVVVLYRAMADFSDVITESAKARAAQKALADDQTKLSQQTAKAEEEVAGKRRKNSSEATQQTAKQVESNKKAASSSDDLWRSIGRQVDALTKNRKALQDQVGATDADVAASRRSSAQSSQLGGILSQLLTTMRNKNKLLKEQAAAQDDDSAATRRGTAASKDMFATIGAQVDGLKRSRTELGGHSEALDQDSRSTAKATLNWDVFTTSMRAQTKALAENRDGLMARIRGGDGTPDATPLPGARGGGGGSESATRGMDDLDRAARRAAASVGLLGAAVRRMRRDASGDAGGGGGQIGGFLERFADAGDRMGSGLGRASRNIISFRGLVLAAIATAGPLVAVLGSLGAAAIGVANTLGSLAGAVAALPGLFFAAASGIGALKVALAPVANVFKLFKASQEEVATGGRNVADAQRQAADRIRNAERAYRAAAQGIVDAQDEERRSQEDLNDARKDALRNLEDLRRELARSALTEQAAILARKEAQDAYQRSLADPQADALDRERAILRVKEAEFDLGDVRIRNTRLAQEAADAEQRGVEGAENVVAARERTEDATRGVTDATLRLEDATRDLADAQRVQSVEGGGAATAMDKLNAALAKLSPSTRAFVEGLLSMSGAWEKVKSNTSEALFKPLVGQLGNIKSLLPTINNLLTTAAGALGNVAAKGIEMISSGPWKADFATLANSNAKILTSLGGAVLKVADGFRHIAVAAAPFTQWVAGAIERMGAGFRDWAKAGRESGSIAKFLETTADRFSQVWRIIKNVGSAIGSLFKASESFTSWFLDRVEAVTGKWKAWGKAQEAANSPFKKWLEDVKPLLSDVWHLVEEVVKTFAGMAADTRNMDEGRKILQKLADDILPKIQRIFGELSESGTIASLVDTLSELLSVFDNLLAAGGSGAFKAFVDGLLLVSQLFAKIMENDQAASVVATMATALGALAAASVIGKWTGLFALAGLMKDLLVSERLGPAGVKAGKGLEALSASAGKAAGVIGAFAIASHVLSSALAEPLNANVSALAKGLKDFGEKGTVAGEVARLFGDDLKTLQGDLHLLGSGAWDQLNTKITEFQEFFAGEDPFGQSVAKGRERIAAFDQALTDLVKNGNVDAANAAFKRLWEHAQLTGISMDDLKSGFPQYIAAAGEAAEATLATSVSTDALTRAQIAAVEAGETLISVWEELHGATKSADEAMLAAIESTEALTEAFKVNGKAIEGNSKGAIENRLKLQDQAKAAYAAADAFIANGGSAKGAQEILDRFKKSAYESAVAAGVDRDKVKLLNDELYRMPPVWSVKVKIEYTSNWQSFRASERGDTGEGYRLPPPPRRWGGVDVHAAAGMLRDAAIYQPSSPARYAFAEPATGGEAFVPKRGDYQRSLEILQIAAGWYGARVTPGAGRGGNSNEARLDPATLYAALNFAAKQVNMPQRGIPTQAAGPGMTTVDNSTRNSGMNFGDVIINNPLQERASNSLRRSLQTLAYLNDR